MKFAHLPVPGGLYDQHPKLMDDFMVIMQAESDAERERQRKEEQKAKSKGRRGKR